MKKIVFSLFICLSMSTVISAQVAGSGSVPVEESTGLVVYEGILDAEGSEEELYNRVLEWFNSHYPNPRNVLQEQDKANGKITGKHKFRLQLTNDKGVPVDAGFIKYMIKVWVKDGKYRYRITDINLENITYFGIEEWMKPDAKDKDAAKKLAATDVYLNEVIASLKEGMIPKETPKDEDEW